MPEIKIKVRDKCAEGEGVIICNNSDYMVVWDLDEEWTLYGTKTMRVNLADGTYQDVVFTGDNAALPVLTASGWVSVGLYAGDIHTTRAARLLALSSVLTPGGSPAAPAEDVYAQIMAKLNELSTVSPEDIAKAVEDYLAEHPAASASMRVEGGYIQFSGDGKTWENVIALADLKGPKGDTGATGPQGPAGAGMDITGATVGQIAKITAVDETGVPTAWSPVDMPSGGAGDEWVKVAEATLTEVVNEIRLNFDPCKAVYIEFQYGAVENDLGVIGIYPNPETPIYTGEDRAAAITQKTSDTNKRGYIFCMIDRRKGTPWVATSQTFHRGDGTFESIEPGALMNCEIRCFNDNTWASLMNPMYLEGTDYINAVSAFGAGMNIGTTLTVWGIKA